MTSRADMDRPATVMTAILGVVLIGASLPFLIFDDDGKEAYNIAWTEATLGETSAPFGNPNEEVVTPAISFTSIMSNVTVVLDCSDTRPAPQLQPAVTITWEAFEDNRSIGSGTTPCAPGNVDRINLTAQPDVGSVRAKSSSAAKASAEDQPSNTTHAYRLELTYNRPNGQVPIGIPGAPATFSGRMTLEVEAWRAAANPPNQEVVR